MKSKISSFNMRYQETSDEVSQIADATSDNANIMPNLWGELQVLSNSNFKHCSTKLQEDKNGRRK